MSDIPVRPDQTIQTDDQPDDPAKLPDPQPGETDPVEDDPGRDDRPDRPDETPA